MYAWTGTELPLAHVQRLLQKATQLNPQPGPGGSGMTFSKATLALFEVDPPPELQIAVPPPWARCQVVGLWPSSQIVAHRDPPLAAAVVRYHLPLQSDAGCWVFHGGAWQQLHVGRLYCMDPAEWHGAVNWGQALRLHLMIDR